MTPKRSERVDTDIVERIDAALGVLDPSIKFGGTMTDLHLLRACKAEIERLRALPAPSQDSIEAGAKALHDHGPRQRNGRRRTLWENEMPEYRDYMREKVRAVLAAALPAPSEWRGMESAPHDGTQIWAYTSEGFQRVVHWEEECPSAPDDPGHDAGWMSHDGSTSPSCFYHKPQPPVDPPLRWLPLPAEPDLEGDFSAPPGKEKEGAE